MMVVVILPMLAGCSASDVAGPATKDPAGAIVFLDSPADVLVGEPMPPLRVRLAGANGSATPSAAGSIVLRVDGNPAGSGAERVYELVDGEGIVRDFVVDAPAPAVRLFASSDELVGVTPPFAVVEDYDAVRLSVDGEAAVYVAGGDNRGRSVGLGSPAEGGTARVGFMRRLPGGANRVLAFGVDRAPAYLTDAGWTPGADTIDLRLRAPVVLDLTVWVMDGNPAVIEGVARDAAEELDRLWSRERAGLVVGDIRIVDARHDPDVAALVGRDATSGWMKHLKRRVGADAGRINIYAVPEVRQGDRSLTGAAVRGGNLIALAPAGWTGATLGHEIGHNLGLGHTDGLDGFDDTNVMHSYAGRRGFLSEGQIARLHFGSTAIMTGLLGSDGGSRGSVDLLRDESLPPLTLRLWTDGRFPATEYSVP